MQCAFSNVVVMSANCSCSVCPVLTFNSAARQQRKKLKKLLEQRRVSGESLQQGQGQGSGGDSDFEFEQHDEQLAGGGAGGEEGSDDDGEEGASEEEGSEEESGSGDGGMSD